VADAGEEDLDEDLGWRGGRDGDGFEGDFWGGVLRGVVMGRGVVGGGEGVPPSRSMTWASCSLGMSGLDIFDLVVRVWC